MLSLSSGPSGSEKTTPPAAEMSRVTTAFANFFYTNFLLKKSQRNVCAVSLSFPNGNQGFRIHDIFIVIVKKVLPRELKHGLQST